jgi:hypothetical protein
MTPRAIAARSTTGGLSRPGTATSREVELLELLIFSSRKPSTKMVQKIGLSLPLFFRNTLC